MATNGWIPRTLPRPSVMEESAHLMLAVKEAHMPHLQHLPHLPHIPHQSQRIATKCATKQQVRLRSEIFVVPVTTAAAIMVLVLVLSVLKARGFVTTLGNAVLVAVLKHVVIP